MPHKRAKHSAREQARSQQGADLAPSKQSLRTEAIPKGAARVLNAARIQQEWRDRKSKSSEDGPRDAADGTARKRKRKGADDDADGNSGGGGGGKVTIMPGESLSHFNRRVEDSMRPLVRTAVKTSAATTRRTKKAEAEAAAASAQAKKAQRASAATGAAPAGDAGEDAAPTPTASSSQHPHPAPAPAPAKRPKTYDDSATRAVKHFAALSTSAPRRLNDIVLAPPELKRLPRGAAARKAAAAGTGTKAGAGAGANLRESMMSMAQKVMLEDERERAITAYRELKRRRTDG